MAGDLEQGIPDEVGDGFDVVLCADILEHVSRARAAALRRARPAGARRRRWWSACPTSPTGTRGRGWRSGRFDYDRRGILDSTHLRFFTRRSFERLAGEVGLGVSRREVTGLPLEVLDRSASEGAEGARWARRWRGRCGPSTAPGQALRPGLFGYQLLYELAPGQGAGVNGPAAAAAGGTQPARAS